MKHALAVATVRTLYRLTSLGGPAGPAGEDDIRAEAGERCALGTPVSLLEELKLARVQLDKAGELMSGQRGRLLESAYTQLPA